MLMQLEEIRAWMYRQTCGVTAVVLICLIWLAASFLLLFSAIFSQVWSFVCNCLLINKKEPETAKR
jgi:hypothetical protein